MHLALPIYDRRDLVPAIVLYSSSIIGEILVI